VLRRHSSLQTVVVKFLLFVAFVAFCAFVVYDVLVINYDDAFCAVQRIPDDVRVHLWERRGCGWIVRTCASLHHLV
jgi:hypothetical protein